MRHHYTGLGLVRDLGNLRAHHASPIFDLDHLADAAGDTPDHQLRTGLLHQAEVKPDRHWSSASELDVRWYGFLERLHRGEYVLGPHHCEPEQRANVGPGVLLDAPL